MVDELLTSDATVHKAPTWPHLTCGLITQSYQFESSMIRC